MKTNQPSPAGTVAEKKKKWQCDVCGEEFRNKKQLIDHLITEWEDAQQTTDEAFYQLEQLGVKNPYEN